MFFATASVSSTFTNIECTPSNEINPSSVHIHRVPSEVIAKLLTVECRILSSPGIVIIEFPFDWHNAFMENRHKIVVRKKMVLDCIHMVFQNRLDIAIGDNL